MGGFSIKTVYFQQSRRWLRKKGHRTTPFPDFLNFIRRVDYKSDGGSWQQFSRLHQTGDEIMFDFLICGRRTLIGTSSHYRTRGDFLFFEQPDRHRKSKMSFWWNGGSRLKFELRTSSLLFVYQHFSFFWHMFRLHAQYLRYSYALLSFVWCDNPNNIMKKRKKRECSDQDKRAIRFKISFTRRNWLMGRVEKKMCVCVFDCRLYLSW
jgi:hypothetical protein